jgi:hemerythrin-like domain-containing protein
MNAIKMLEEQHRQIEKLFQELEKVPPGTQKSETFDDLADVLAVHAAIEERHFYPSVNKRPTEGTLLESVEEHLAIKRVLADLLALDDEDQTFEAKLKVLKDEVRQHVEHEERNLFPKVAQLFDPDLLDEIGAAMEKTQQELWEEGDPREAVPEETEHAAPI